MSDQVEDFNPAVRPITKQMTDCDTCGGSLSGVAYDAATRMGPWANMCHGCFRQYGVGLGTGLGQKYERIAPGLYEKVPTVRTVRTVRK